MQTNERLRGSIASAGIALPDFAAAVDPKTVERWITKGRLPQRTHRRAVADRLGVDETYLWPQVLSDPKTQAASVAELLELHPSRSAVPQDLWRHLINGTHEAMDVLVYAGTFLFEQYDLTATMREKAAHGVRFRILIGDETLPAVQLRAEEEGTVGGLQGRIQLCRRYLRDVIDLPGVEVRTHGSTLYNSLYRFDQDLLVNGHVYGAPAGQSPVLHLRRVPGGRLWDHYLRSCEAVWKIATPGD